MEGGRGQKKDGGKTKDRQRKYFRETAQGQLIETMKEGVRHRKRRMGIKLEKEQKDGRRTDKE